MYRIILLFIIFFPAICLGQLPGKLNINGGQKFGVDIEFSNKLVQQTEGQAIDFVVAGIAIHKAVTLSASPDSLRFEHHADRIRFEFEGMNTRLAFDSDSEADMEGELGEYFAPHKKPFVVATDNMGVITSVYGNRNKVVPDTRLQVILGMVEDLSIYSTPPAAGKQSFLAALVPTGTAPGGQWTTGSGDAKIIFTLQSLDDSKYIISYQQTITDSTVADLNGIRSVSKFTTQKDGTITAQVATGMITNHHYTSLTNGIREAMGSKIPFSSRKNVTIRIRPE